MNNAPYGKTIENVALRTDIRLLNDMEKARKLAEKPHCVDFRLLVWNVAPPDEQVEDAAAKEQQQQEALVGIEMRKLNHFITKPFVNGFCLLEYSKLKMYEMYIAALYLISFEFWNNRQNFKEIFLEANLLDSSSSTKSLLKKLYYVLLLR